MTEHDAKALAEKALVVVAISAVQLSGVYIPDLGLPQGRTEAHKAEVMRLHRDFLAEQGTMDRYLDSRDQENDDVSKEIVLKPAQQETLYTFAQPKGAPATGDDHDRS